MKTLPLLLFPLLATAAALPDLSTWEREAAAEMARGHMPGAVVGVVREGKLVYAKGFGVASVETGEAARPDQLFRLGSTTKMMTAAALLVLAQQGKLDLHAPVRTYIPDLPPALGAVTTHQLLTHSAGLKDAASMAGSHDDEALARYIRSWNDSWLFTRPGRVLSYSNPGYHLAGSVLETIAGKPYATAMEELLFRPLGMKRTTLRPLTAMTYPLAQGHEVRRPGENPTIVRPAADDSSQWPAGSVFTSIEEWSRFVIALLEGGRVDGAQVLPPKLVDLLTQRHQPSVEAPGSHYGYGILVGRDRGLTFWQHGGSRAGYGSLLIMAPERRTAVFAICNRSGANLGSSLPRLLDTLLALPPENEPKPPAPAPIDAGLSSRLAGLFRNGDSVVRITPGKDAVEVRMNARMFTARQAGPDKLALEKGPLITVLYDANGKAEFVCASLRCFARAIE
jgi:CubicO group peptidase (beta-lactamase class C family)